MQTKPCATILQPYLTINHFPRILGQKCASILCSGQEDRLRNIIWKRNIQTRHQWHYHPHRQGVVRRPKLGCNCNCGVRGASKDREVERRRCHHGGTKNKQTILLITMVRELCLDHGSHGGSIHHGDGAIRGAIRSLAHHLPLPAILLQQITTNKVHFL